MLPIFEKSALLNTDESKSNFHESKKLNKLLDIFENAIRLIEIYKGNHYQFSDNICITLPYVGNEDNLVNALLIVNRLYNEFAREGYFLRGGMDIGWFLDDKSIAIGMPLANSYKLESIKAKHPRILLSDKFVNLTNLYIKRGYINEDLVYIWEYGVMRKSKINFINPFSLILNYDDKESKIGFLRKFKFNIQKQLNNHEKNKKVLKKYNWLRKLYNNFIIFYCKNYKEIEVETLFTVSEINKLKKLKI